MTLAFPVFNAVEKSQVPWLNSYVIVKKPNGSLRIYLDPTDLNKYIVRPDCNSHIG